MKIKCPFCNHSAPTRSSVYLSKKVVHRYHQCINIKCGCVFKSETTVILIIHEPVKLSANDKALLDPHKNTAIKKSTLKSAEGEGSPKAKQGER